MFTIIYNIESGSIINITTKSDENNLREALTELEDFIFVENLPKYDFNRQELKIINNEIIVKDLVLSEEQERKIEQLETILLIGEYKKFLTETDYKTLKFIDGDLSEDEYAPIRIRRQNARDKINELESKNTHI